MHFWQIKKLRVKLAGEELTQRQEFIYYLGGAILVAALYEIVANGPATEQKPVDVLDAVMYFGFKIGGGRSGEPHPRASRANAGPTNASGVLSQIGRAHV